MYCSTFKQSHLFNSYDKYCYSLTLFTFLNPNNVNKELKNTKALQALSNFIKILVYKVSI